MTTPDSCGRDRVLKAAKIMAREPSRDGFSFEAVAARAEVEVVTVEYFFDSPAELIAEAQLSNYAELVKSQHLEMTRVQAALANEDLDGFLVAIAQNLDLAWTSGQIGNRWGIIEMLHDIWGDPFVKSHFCEMLDIQFQGWINIIEVAQQLGWIGADIDAKALVSVFWSSSVGQLITAGSSMLNLTPQQHRDFIMRIVRPPSYQGSH